MAPLPQIASALKTYPAAREKLVLGLPCEPPARARSMLLLDRVNDALDIRPFDRPGSGALALRILCGGDPPGTRPGLPKKGP